jgi:hypothetical protein
MLALDIHSRWLPDYLVECGISDCMNLVLFHTILERRESTTDETEAIFLHASLRPNQVDETIPLRLQNHQSQLLNIRVGSRNAYALQPLQRTIKQIMDEATSSPSEQP